MRKWLKLFEGDELLGPLSETPVNNTGELGHLEDVLNLWVQGELRQAQPLLLPLRDFASRYSNDHVWLYRGMTLINPDFKTMARDGLSVEHHNGKVLESWSTDDDCVIDYMSSYEEPWVVMTTRDADVLIDLAKFDQEADPFTNMAGQSEVIVMAPAIQHFTPDQLMVDRYVVQYHKLAPLTERLHPGLNPITAYEWY